MHLNVFCQKTSLKTQFFILTFQFVYRLNRQDRTCCIFYHFRQTLGVAIGNIWKKSQVGRLLCGTTNHLEPIRSETFNHWWTGHLEHRVGLLATGCLDDWPRWVGCQWLGNPSASLSPSQLLLVQSILTIPGPRPFPRLGYVVAFWWIVKWSKMDKQKSNWSLLRLIQPKVLK